MKRLAIVALLSLGTVAHAQYYYYSQPNKVFNINNMQVSSSSYARAYSVQTDAFVMAEQIRRQVQAQLEQSQVVYVDRPVPVQQPPQVVYVDRLVPALKTAAVEEDSPRTEFLKECQRYGYSKTRCINIWDDKIIEDTPPKPVAKIEIKPKSTYRPARDDEIIVERKEEPKPAPIVFTHKPATVPADVDLTNEQERLTKLGIPIISGVRSASKQELLKDHQGPDGRWYTAAGNPVADHSHHLTGNAIDTGPLNAAQRRILAENGWFQPIPQQDPNHWEKVKLTLIASK